MWTAIWFTAILAVTSLHVLVAPYTKVEESFTLHAVHDLLRFGPWPSSFDKWDHRTFPGAVPRSFLPPLVLGALSYPAAWAAAAFQLVRTPIGIQIIIRLTLALMFTLCYTHLARTLQRRYGAATASWFVAFSLAQFHVPYYAGRTLPNFMALPLVILSISLLLRRRTTPAIIILTAVATVVRLEIALLVVPITLGLFLRGEMPLIPAVVAGMIGGFGSLAVAAPIDHTLWAPTLPHPSLPSFTALHTLWPELSAAIFNVVDGHAEEWGVMPIHYYAGALTKMLLGAFPLFLLGLGWALLNSTNKVTSNKNLQRCVGDVTRLLGPSVVSLIGVLSLVGHKEWRFIVYAIPILNIIAASAAAALAYLPSRWMRSLARLGLLGLLALTAAFTVFSTWVSTHNYPGGDVWQAIEYARIPANSSIHFQSYPLQTGASLFTFLHHEMPPSPAFPAALPPTYIYSKDEDVKLRDPRGAWDAGLDYVVTPFWDEFIASRNDGQPMWRVITAIDGFNGVGLGGKYGITVKTDRKVALLKRM